MQIFCKLHPCPNGPWYKVSQWSLIFFRCLETNQLFWCSTMTALEMKFEHNQPKQMVTVASGSLTSIDPSPYLHQPALGEQVMPKWEGLATNSRCNCLKIWSRRSTTRIYKKNKWQVLVIEDFRTQRSQKIINRWDQYLKNVKTLKTLEKLKLQDLKTLLKQIMDLFSLIP